MFSELAGLLAGIADPANRRDSVRSLCQWIQCDDLILFLPDPELHIPVPAAGFPKTLPNGRAWREFVRICREKGEHRSDLPYPGGETRAETQGETRGETRAETLRPVLGFATADGSVVALAGGFPDAERRRALIAWIPLLARALHAERTAFFATQRAILDRQTSAQSTSLAERLDTIATENARLFHEAEKNLAERKLIEADQRRFVALVENSSDFIGLFSASGEALFINRGGLSMVGLQIPGEAHGLRFDEFFPEEQRAFARDRIVPDAIKTGRWTGETKFANHSSGAAIDVHQTTFSITQADDMEPILATITRDITESKRAEERLRHTAKLESLGVMAGGLAHDFNNLLTGIMGNASLLLTSVAPADADMAQEIVNASERAAHLTRQMLAYSGKGRFLIKSLNLSDEVREILDVVKSSIAKNVAVELDLRDNLAPIEADPGQIQQLIMNLVINASEAMDSKPGKVTIKTEAQEVDTTYASRAFGVNRIQPGHYVSLEVHDTGCGMSDETQGKIFDPFFTTKFTGRGLGLAAVSGIVRGHKGALKVYSVLGGGTTFKVIFPAAQNYVKAPSSQVMNAVKGTGTVLVIDDEAIVRNVAAAALERAGYKVIVADDGDTGVELFRLASHEVSLVILDMTMPRMSGEEALTRLREIRPDIPVIVSSGYNEVEIIRRFTTEGIAGFVQKPYSATRILAKIQEVMKKKSGTGRDASKS